MGSQLCNSHSSYESLENQIRQINEIKSISIFELAFLGLYPLIDEKFKIYKKYFSSPSFTQISKSQNKVLFHSSTIQYEQNQSKQFEGLVFQQNKSKNNQSPWEAWVYQGGFRIDDGCKEFLGYFIGDNGDVYEGQWHNDLFHGMGRLQSVQNSYVYIGNFKQGKKCGKGQLIMQKPLKIKYQGDFFENQMCGKGTIYFQNGQTYEGQMAKGLQNGYGIYKTQNMIYEGMWQNGQMQGSGKCKWLNNQGKVVSQYIGEYKNGRKHGFGQYKNKDKKILRGQWIQGKFQSGIGCNMKI